MSEPALSVEHAERAVGAALAAGEFELPLVPTVVADVLASSLDDNRDAAYLATVIQQDQTMATHVLRVVNSPLYRAAQEIVALQQAIARLGLDLIREIAITVSLRGTLFDCPSYKGLADDAWRHALATAWWSKEVARATRSNVEIAYLGGLLHNVGSTLLLQCLTTLGFNQLPLAQAQELVATFTGAAGGALARAWDLPEPVTAVIENVGDFRRAGEFERTVAVVALGALYATLAHDDAFELNRVTSREESQILSLYPDQVEALWERREMIASATEAMR